MTGFLRLIRIPNLIIIALTMLAVRYGIVQTLWERAAYDFFRLDFIPKISSCILAGFTLAYW